MHFEAAECESLERGNVHRVIMISSCVAKSLLDHRIGVSGLLISSLDISGLQLHVSREAPSCTLKLAYASGLFAWLC